MSNRHQRRAAGKQRKTDIARFKAEVGDNLDSYLVAAEDVDTLARMPRLARAGCWWADGIAVRQPTCIGCEAGFGVEAEPGAFLFAVPTNAPATSPVSVSAFCVECWQTLTACAIEEAACKVLRQLLPHGKFVGGWGAFSPRDKNQNEME